MKQKMIIACLFTAFLSLGQIQAVNIIDINFNSGVDSKGDSEGLLRFDGTNGFQVFFTDDDSTGAQGGDANGVHITNTNFGNSKVGSSDLVLAANNDIHPSGNNFHSSGIIATFNQGASLVSFDDTDDDGTLKALFAFNAANELIGQSAFASRTTVVVDLDDTGGELIFKVEFDTLAGTAGGSNDGTFFTIDNFHAETNEEETAPPPGIDPGLLVPEPSSIVLAAFALLFGFYSQRKK